VSAAAEKTAEVIGELTADWEVRQIQEVAEVNPRIDKKAIPDNIEVSFVPMPAVEAESGGIDVSQTKLAKEVKKGFTAFLQGDVLFAKITPCMENGKMAIAPALVNDYGFGSTEFHVLRPGEDIEAKYLYYYVSSKSFRGEAERFMTGAVGQKRVSTTYIKEATIPIAPLEDQCRIVAEIEKQFSRLDEAVASLKRVKANLKRYKTAVLKAAVEGNLTEEWRKQNPDVEPARKRLERILTERRTKWEEAELAKMKGKGKEPKNDKWKEKYKKPTLPKQIDSSQLPARWSYAGIDQLLPSDRAAMKTGPFGSLLKKSEHRLSGIPVLGIENIAAMRFVFGSKIHITPQKAADLTGYAVSAGDVLVSRSGTVGEVCVVPEDIGDARISTNLMKICLMAHGMRPRFFTMLFNGSPSVLAQVRELCKGSTRDFINQNILKSMVFPLPPLLEQDAIFTAYDELVSGVESLEGQIEVCLIRAEAQRQAILRNHFFTRVELKVWS